MPKFLIGWCRKRYQKRVDKVCDILSEGRVSGVFLQADGNQNIQMLQYHAVRAAVTDLRQKMIMSSRPSPNIDNYTEHTGVMYAFTEKEVLTIMSILGDKIT